MLKKNTIVLAKNFLIFICLLFMFFFIVPQSDVFLFARGTDGSVVSAYENALLYGNGRFLGNFISMYLSNHFETAGILVALTMSLIVFTANHLFFGKSKYIFFTALIVIFPSIGIIKECYYLFAAFINYMFPVLIILASLILIKSYNSNNKQFGAIKIIFIFILGFSSCLFSENTSIVLAALAFLLVFYDIISTKKISLSKAVYFVSIFLGSLTMLLIPKLTETSWKMEHYRGIAVNPVDIIFTAAGSFIKFSQIFSSFLPAIWILCISLIFTAIKYKNEKFFKIQLFVFITYPVFSSVLGIISLTSSYIPWLYIIHAVSLIVFMIACVCTVFSIKEKETKIKSLIFLILIASSIAPMMIVNQYGYRTYVTTYFLTVFMGIFLIKVHMPTVLSENIFKLQLDKNFCLTCMTCFVLCSAFITSQTIYNYNFYAVRTNYISEQIKNDSESFAVPVLPCNSVSIEDEWSNIIKDITDTHARKINISEFTHCENSEEYKEVLASSLPSQVIQAFKNLEYKDPLIIEK